jgi:hypothetical protein
VSKGIVPPIIHERLLEAKYSRQFSKSFHIWIYYISVYAVAGVKTRENRGGAKHPPCFSAYPH